MKSKISHFFLFFWKKIKRSLSLATILAVILSSLGSIFMYTARPIYAASTVNVSTGNLVNANFPGTPIKASSAATAIVKISVTAASASQTLTSVTLNFSGTGFATTTLADITTGDTSGVALYNDAGSGNTGSFVSGSDAAVTLAANPAWVTGAANIVLTPATPATLTSGSAKIFYVVIKTASGAVNGTRIAAAIAAGGVATSDGSGPSASFLANDLLVDTTAPTITAVDAYVNSSQVTVRFSEPVQKTGGGALFYTAPGNPFTIASSTISIVNHTVGNNVATITMGANVATGDIFNGGPNTLTSSSTASTITDMAGNNLAFSPVNFSSPLRITTASIPGTYVGASYSTTFQADGGAGSKTWASASSTDATLLTNLSLSLNANSGVLSGTVANKTGSYTYNVSVSAGGLSTSTKAFAINVAGSSGGSIPGITSVSPPGASRNASGVTITITGANTHFSSSSALQILMPFGVEGTNGVATSTLTAMSATTLTVSISVAANAALGYRDLKITTGSEVVNMPNALAIFAGGDSGLALQFPTDAATNVQIPPGFSFNPSGNANINTYRIVLKSTSDFSGPDIWDYAFPKPSDVNNTNASHCNATSCSVSFGNGQFRQMTQPTTLAPNTTYYWQVRTYAETIDSLNPLTSLPLETTAIRSFTTVTSITDTVPPNISHRPIFRAKASTDLNLFARVVDNIAATTTSPALGSSVFYCAGAACAPGNETTATSVGSGYFNYTIPGATVGTADTVIRYYLKASDGSNNATTTIFQLTSATGGSVSISGTVKNSSAACVPGLYNSYVFAEGTGFFTKVSNDGNCTFTLGSMNAGTYDLTAFAYGYSDRAISGLSTGATNIPFSLTSGAAGGFGGDSTKPRIRFTGPMDGMTNMPGGDSGFRIFIVFDKSMSRTSVTTTGNLTVNSVNQSTGVLTDITANGSWTYYSTAPGAAGIPNEANMAVWSFSGSNTFGDNKAIAVIVGSGVTDTAGNPVQGNQSDGSYAFSFTTGSTASFSGGALQGGTFGSGAFVPPSVTGTTPTPGSFSVPQNSKIVIKFSEAMADDGSGYLLKNFIKLYTVSGTTEIDVSASAINTVTLSSDKSSATLALLGSFNSGLFAASATYRVKVLGGAKAATNITLAPPTQASTVMFQSDFKTGTSSDTAAPTVLGSYPDSGAASVPVSVGAISVGFSKDMDASTLTASTFYLSSGSATVNANVEYKPLERQAFLILKSALTPNTTYTVNVTTGVQGLNGVALASAVARTFTTGSADGTSPAISFMSVDDYNIVVTFSEPMNAAKATDTLNWATSVLNPAAYDVIKYGASGFATSTAGTLVDISGGSFSYDAAGNTVNIKGVNLSSAIGQDLYLSYDNNGSNVPKDLSNNGLSGTSNSTRSTIQNTATTKGALGPGSFGGDAFGQGGGFRPDNFDSGTFGFAPPVEVRPFNTMAGLTSNYGVRLPISKQIPSGGIIVLTFPTGFDVSLAQQDVNSPMRTDINGPGTGAITFKCQTNVTTSKSCGGGAANSDDTGSAQGGLADDGVVVNTNARTVTIYVSGATNSAGHDFLSLDLAGIKNSTIPKDFNTSGYTVDVKTKNGSTILESMASKPIFIQTAGSSSLTGTITASSASTGTMKVYLMSPMTGPIDATSGTFAAGSATYTFSNIPDGDFALFTDQVITLGANEYAGKATPERVTISGSANYNFTIASNTSGGTAFTVNITGGPASELMDIFAASPTGFKVRQVTLDADGATTTALYLGDGNWSIGAGPQMPKGFSSGPPPAPNYVPPKSKSVVIANPACTVEGGTTACSLTFALSTANKNIKGIVKDGSGKVMANAEVYAYSPNGGTGTHTQSDTTGVFTLKVTDGSYVVGSFVPGMPPSKEVSVVVTSDANTYLLIDGATTAITPAAAASAFILKVAKPDYTISGKVNDGTNMVQGASVYAYRSDGPGHSSASTDSSGNYTLYVSNGTWKVGVFLPQYGQLTEQTVTISGASSSNQNFSPSSTGTFYAVSGNVKVGGTNRQGAFVRLSGNGTFNEAITDSSGNYSFNVPGGNGYTLKAFIPGIGETAPLDAFNVSAAVPNKNFSVGAVNAITFAVSPVTSTVSSAFIDLFSSTGVGGRAEIKNATSTTMSLPNGSYKVSVNIPGINIGLTDVSARTGDTVYSNTTGIVTVDGDEGLTITLPTLRTVSGTVSDGANTVASAWVEIGNPSNGVHFGTSSASDGTFSLKVVDSTSNYFINASKPGYFRESTSLNVNGSDRTGQTLTIGSASTTISGQILIGASGAANAFIRAEKQGGGFSGTQADANGNYTLPVSSGVWKVYAVADGYAETAYASNPIDVANGSVTGKNVTLSSTITLNPLKTKPITPSSGGTLEDTTAGVKITIPANALGTSSSAGNVQSKDTNNVRNTDTAKVIKKQDSASGSYASSAKEIKATDSKGTPITTLSDSITVEMDYTKAELAATSSTSDSSIDSKTEADKLKMSYWDETTSTWVTLPTTITYKNSAGSVITDATTIDTASEFASNVSTVTISTATTHLSLYAPVGSPDPLAPSTPSGFLATAQNSSQINLGWREVSGADSYDIYRSSSLGGTYDRIGSEPTISSVSTVSYNDTGLSAGATYYYKITALTGSKESAASGVVSATTSSTGSSSSSPSSAPTTSGNANTQTTTPATTPQSSLNSAPAAVNQTPASAATDTNLVKVKSEAAAVATGIKEQVLALVSKIVDAAKEQELDKSVISKVVAGIKAVKSETRAKILNFVAYGTPTTQILGEGERGGVVNSFKEAFGKLPETEADWQDVVKIGNGRWPSQTSKPKEDRATASFKSIYKRAPDRSNARDDAAVVVMSYGLRPANRNLNSEKAAIKSYRAVFGRQPVTATAWDAVRAIAYSGAKR